MSRCKACDVILNEHELKRKDPMTDEYLDLCHECLSESNQALYESDGFLDDETGATINLSELGLQ
jgi:hypothetical protein